MADVVMDSGSEWSKVGFVGAMEPQAMFRSAVGLPKSQVQGQKNFFVGDEAQKRRDVLNLTSPVERGLITHWDHMEKLWHHSFYTELKVAPEKQRVVLAESPFNTAANREKTAQIMFETFSVPALFLANQAGLTLYSTGRMSGLVVECGAEVTHTVALHQGFPVKTASQRLELGGRDFSDFMMKLLKDRGHTVEWDVAQDIKEKLCYLPLTIKTEAMKDAAAVEHKYQLPDGQNISVGQERFHCPEALLQPSLMGKSCAGVHTAAFETVTKCDGGIREELWKNVVLSGGCSLFPGLSERLQKELTAMKPSTAVKIYSPGDRRCSVWLGGSILGAQLAPDHWVNKAEYEEKGVSVLQKCP